MRACSHLAFLIRAVIGVSVAKADKAGEQANNQFDALGFQIVVNVGIGETRVAAKIDA